MSGAWGVSQTNDESQHQLLMGSRISKKSFLPMRSFYGTITGFSHSKSDVDMFAIKKSGYVRREDDPYLLHE